MSVRRRRRVSDGDTENTEISGRRALIVGGHALNEEGTGTPQK
jgi:hypothetical protein